MFRALALPTSLNHEYFTHESLNHEYFTHESLNHEYFTHESLKHSLPASLPTSLPKNSTHELDPRDAWIPPLFSTLTYTHRGHSRDVWHEGELSMTVHTL